MLRQAVTGQRQMDLVILVGPFCDSKGEWF